MKNLRLSLTLASTLLLPACGGGSSGGGGGANVPGPTNLSYPEDVIVLLKGVVVSGLVPSVDGSIADWSIAPSLPSGVTLNASNGAITGTPSALSAPATYTITASNAGGSVEAEIELAVARPAGFLVAANEDDDTLTSYAVEPQTGRLLPQGYVDSGASDPEGVWRHPALDVLYVPHLGPGGGSLEVFVLDRATGAPVWLASRSLNTGPHHLAIAPDGQTLYVVARGASTLQAFALDPQSGSPTPLGIALPTGANPTRVALDPQGQFAFVCSEADASISIYDLDSATGAPTPGPPAFVLNGSMPGGLACSRSGDHLFVTAMNFGLLVSLAVDDATGALSVVNAVSTGPTPVDLAVHPDGRSIAVVQAGDETLSSYPVDRVSGVLGAEGPAQGTGASPQRVTYDESGLLAYVANAASNDLSVFTVAPGEGTLTAGSPVRARKAPSGVAVVASDLPVRTVADNMYVVNAADGTLSNYSINPASGLLTELSAPLLLPNDPIAIAIDPHRRFAFVCNSQDGIVWTVTLAADGTPSVPVAPLSVVANPTDLAVDPNGEYLYVSGEGVGELASYQIDQATGALTMNQTLLVNGQPTALAVDPTGRFLVAADAGGGRLFSIEVLDGAFVGPVHTTPAGGGPINLRFSSHGRFVWVSMRFADLVIPFEIDAVSGALTALPPGAGTGNQTEPFALDLHPNARFAYAALYVGSGTGSVVSYTLDELTGALAEFQRLDDGLGPIDLRVNPQGSTVYVLNQDGDDISVFSSGVNGGLAPAGVTLTGDAPIDLVLSRRLQ
jgi:6-phosphogluconolactonase (cycloisomerase 2 family)